MPRLRCEVCHGTGNCPRCDATGIIQVPQQFQTVTQAAICPDCIGYKTCHDCLGLGYILKESKTMAKARKARKESESDAE